MLNKPHCLSHCRGFSHWDIQAAGSEAHPALLLELSHSGSDPTDKPAQLMGTPTQPLPIRLLLFQIHRESLLPSETFPWNPPPTRRLATPSFIRPYSLRRHFSLVKLSPTLLFTYSIFCTLKVRALLSVFPVPALDLIHGNPWSVSLGLNKWILKPEEDWLKCVGRQGRGQRSSTMKTSLWWEIPGGRWAGRGSGATWCWEPHTEAGALRAGQEFGLEETNGRWSLSIFVLETVKTTGFCCLSRATVEHTAFLTKATALGAFQKCSAWK